MMRYLFLALTVLVGLPGLARAQSETPYQPRIAGTPFQCTSSTGVPVAFVPNASLADIGLALPERPDVPAHVEYNPELLARLPSWMQLFWYGHVCAHEALAIPHSEESADCWSLQMLKYQRFVSRAEVLALQSAFSGALLVPWGHQPGPTRAQRLLECYDRSSGAVSFNGQLVYPGQPVSSTGAVGGSSVPVGASSREEYPGVKRWRFCSHIPGVSAPTSSGHVSQGSCERARARLQEEDTSYVVTECVLTSSERCSAEQR